MVLDLAPILGVSPQDPASIPQAHGCAVPRRSRSSPPRLDTEDAAALCLELRRGMEDGSLGGRSTHLCPLAESASLYWRDGNEATHQAPSAGPSCRPGDVSMSPNTANDSPSFDEVCQALQWESLAPEEAAEEGMGVFERGG